MLASGALISFGYDAAGQLTSESRTGTSAYSYSYTYDDAGNRLTKSRGTFTEQYAYDDANKLQTATTAVRQRKRYNYDGNGNISQVIAEYQNDVTLVWSPAATTNVAWDAESRLTGITYPSSATNSFVYNHVRVWTWPDFRGSINTIKKRWQSIYARIEEVERCFFGTPSGLETSRRGAEKRRLLLNYLRHHREELRPIIRPNEAYVPE